MSTGDKVFTVINTVIMILVCIAIVYPLYYVLLASVTDPVVVSSGKISSLSGSVVHQRI